MEAEPRYCGSGLLNSLKHCIAGINLDWVAVDEDFNLFAQHARLVESSSYGGQHF
jgi:hypothetical protein